ncbi:hypothetical protein PTTG_30509 [Puccinia triticina 1-1 BBBD Race 1]|uniref:Uncharacterized protein n=1 Tax=Puccinia triticina (isolate 1-1 / race 1 (BBBD)) TaxID=630390 RepID=A0A180FYT3_PUCT1|nr:hypothetical protein PTTG_30509 [Puccinia triticina 1-1 BBBD Race 1]
MSKRQGSTSKGKSAAPKERSSSPLASLASISQANAGDLTNEHILSNHKTRNLIRALDFKQTKLEGKINNIIDAVNKINNHIKANHKQPPHFKQEQSTVIPAPTYSLNQKQFMKDPMALHRLIHSDVEYLQFSGKNYSAWERQVNMTLDFVFQCENFLSKPTNWVLVDDDQEPAVVILLRGLVEKKLQGIVNSLRQPKTIFEKLKARCKQNDRQNKLALIGKLREFYLSKRQPSNNELLSQFQEFFLEIQQKKIANEEFFGLILQSIVRPPIDVDENLFRNNLNHRLNTSTTIPTLDTVCAQITQVEGELHTGTPKNPILINHMQPSQPAGQPST